jgi:hypothetical protein
MAGGRLPDRVGVVVEELAGEDVGPVPGLEAHLAEPAVKGPVQTPGDALGTPEGVADKEAGVNLGGGVSALGRDVEVQDARDLA